MSLLQLARFDSLLNWPTSQGVQSTIFQSTVNGFRARNGVKIAINCNYFQKNGHFGSFEDPQGGFFPGLKRQDFVFVPLL
jgi:hypothetical protein